MANTASNNKEREAGLSPAVEKSPGGQMESREFLDASRDFIEDLSSIVEAGETGEISEFSEGNIAETAGEGKQKAAGGAVKTGGRQVQRGKVRQLPSIEIMQIQVSTKIEKEIRVLEKEMAKLMSAHRANFSPHKLNDVIAKIRSLRELLANLVYSTADAIKALWVKYVKGAG